MKKIIALVIVFLASTIQASIYKFELPELIGDYETYFSYNHELGDYVGCLAGGNASILTESVIPNSEVFKSVKLYITAKNSEETAPYTTQFDVVRLCYGDYSNSSDSLFGAVKPNNVTFGDGNINRTIVYGFSLPYEMPDFISVNVYLTAMDKNIVVNDACLLLETVPEPCSLAMLGIGGVMLLRKRVL